MNGHTMDIDSFVEVSEAFPLLMDEADVIKALGGSRALSRSLGLTWSTVTNWKTWGIPPARWPELIELGWRIGIPDITLERLLAIHKRRKHLLKGERP